MDDDVSIVRTSAVALALWGGCALLLTTGLDLLPSGPATVDAMVGLVVVALGCVAAAVLATGVTALGLAAAARRAGRSAALLTVVAHRLTPAVVRQAVGVSLGAGLSLTLGVTGASADEMDIGWRPTVAVAPAAGTLATRPGPGPTVATVAGEPGTTDGTGILPASLGVAPPDDSVEPASPETDATVTSGVVGVPGPGVAAASRGEHVVVAGDSLWSIAGAHLPGAGDAAIAEAWPRWYEVNREVVGPDPDLIHPGQVLRAPTPATAEERP